MEQKMKKITYVSLLTLAFLACGTFVSCSKDNEDEKGGHGKISVTIDESGIATQGHTFVAIDARNFYLDYIKYTVEDGHLVVTGCDDAGINGIAKIVSDVTLRGNHYEVLGIVERAFEKCKGFDTVIIPDGVRSIGGYAFWECVYLTALTIPSSVTSIGDNAFLGCSGLTSINVESGNPKYDSRDNCNAIIETATNTLINGCSKTIIPSSVTSIGESAFEYCSGLTSVTIPNSVTSIGDYAFVHSGLTSLTIPSSVISIGDGAFSGCSGLTSLTILCPSVYDCFEGNTSIKELSLGDKVTSIPGYAFKGCSGLASVTIGNNVTSIGGYAFFDCSGLTDVFCYALAPPIFFLKCFSNANAITLHVPVSSIDAYKSAVLWRDFGNIVAIE